MAARPPGSTRLTAALRPALLALLLSGTPVALTVVLLSLPWHALEAFMEDPSGARITDRNGALIGLVPGPGGSFEEEMAPGEIPAQCAAMFVRLEDGRFRFHPGVDFLALARAVADRARGGGTPSGASTITMQLARTVVPHSRSVASKLVEALGGRYGMAKAAKLGEWNVQAAAVQAAILKAQDPAKISMRADGTSDAISGASIRVTAVPLAVEALKAAR